MAPFLPQMVARLRAFGELDLDDATAGWLAGERKPLALKVVRVPSPGPC